MKEAEVSWQGSAAAVAGATSTRSGRPYRAPTLVKRERLSQITAEDSKAASGVSAPG